MKVFSVGNYGHSALVLFYSIVILNPEGSNREKWINIQALEQLRDLIVVDLHIQEIVGKGEFAKDNQLRTSIRPYISYNLFILLWCVTHGEVNL